MRDRLPRPRELAVFVAMAVVCTVILGVTGKYDVGLAVLGGPVFLISAVMGLNRHAQVTKLKLSSDESAEKTVQEKQRA